MLVGDGVTQRETAQFLCWPFAGKSHSVFIGSVHGGRKDSSFSKVGNVVKLVKLQLHSTFTSILSQNLTVKRKRKTCDRCAVWVRIRSALQCYTSDVTTHFLQPNCFK